MLLGYIVRFGSCWGRLSLTVLEARQPTHGFAFHQFFHCILIHQRHSTIHGLLLVDKIASQRAAVSCSCSKLTGCPALYDMPVTTVWKLPLLDRFPCCTGGVLILCLSNSDAVSRMAPSKVPLAHPARTVTTWPAVSRSVWGFLSGTGEHSTLAD